MPRGKAQIKPTKPDPTHGNRYSPQEDEWGGFVNVRVEEGHKDEFNLWWSENLETIVPMLEDFLAKGLKLSVSWDGQNQSMIATFTGRPTSDPAWPFRCSMSSRASGFWEAIALLLYKEFVITGGDWTPWTVNGRKKDNWG